jgi:hypothetical protein
MDEGDYGRRVSILTSGGAMAAPGRGTARLSGGAPAHPGGDRTKVTFDFKYVRGCMP